MYKISVPVLPRACRANWDLCIDQLKKAGAERVFVISNRQIGSPIAYEEDRQLAEEGVRVLREAGFEIGIWIGETIGHGVVLGAWAIRNEIQQPTLYTDAMGQQLEGCYCPQDTRFLDHVARWARDMAALKPTMIMLDDDFRMSMRGSDDSAIGCLCDLHVADFCRRVGKQMTRDEIRRAVFTGLNPEYRKAWLDMQGDSLRRMAQVVRDAVDSVDPTIRVGQCTCTTLWDPVDGVSALELARIFSPRTKPFIRLAGACSMAGRESYKMSDCIELERRNAQYAREQMPGIELMVEGDPFPRPRYVQPAAHLEDQDMMMRADGHTDGILKYMGEYTASPAYETGYFDRHNRNAERYQAIERMFAGKWATGVRVLECRDLIRETVFPEGDGFVSTWSSMHNNPTPAMRFISKLCFPTTFAADSDCVTLAFNQNALHTTHEMRQNGVILNMRGALLLKEQGVDVGIRTAEKRSRPITERYLAENEVINTMWGGDAAYDMTLDDRACVQTELLIGDKTCPGVFEYENADGEKFVILPFDEATGPIAECYCRERQMAASIARIGRPLAASCTGHPALYMIVKENEREVTIGLLNLSVDEMIDPTVTLAFDGAVKETLDCRVRQEGRLIHIEGDILSNRLAVITVEKV